MGIEDLLSHPSIWRGCGTDSADSSADPSIHPSAHTPAIATGFDVLDRYLPGGGWPLSGISEIFIEHYGLGELSVLMPAMAAISRRAAEARKWIVWIAPPFVPYAPALAQHGVDLGRILLVHPSARQPGSNAGNSSKETLWAVEQAIRSQSSVAAFAWVRDADMTALRRLQLGAEAHRCWTVLFRPAEMIGRHSPAALQFVLSSARALPGGDPGNPTCDPYLCDGNSNLCPGSCGTNGDCVEVCPVECIPHDPNHVETREQLMLKYEKLTGKQAV